MRAPLFRPEVLAGCLHPEAGRPLPCLPVRFRYLALAAGLVGAVIVALLFFGEYTRKITVPGYVKATEANIRVFPRSPGTVTRVFVREGEEIRDGQRLFEVASAGIIDADDEVIESIALELAAVDQQLAASRALHDARTKNLLAKHRDDRRRHRYLQERVAVAGARLRLTEKQHERSRDTIARKYLAVADLERSEKELLADKDAKTIIQREFEALASALESTGGELAELNHAHEFEQAALMNERRRTETRLYEAAGRRRHVVNAPVGGRVTTLTIKTGMRSDPDRPSLSIVPTATRYQVRLYLPGRALSFVETRNRVNLRFEAFPFQKFGLQHGRLASIATGYLLPREVDAPINVREAVYPATVELDNQHLSFQGKTLSLNTGLLVEADILLDRRSLIEWLLEPLIGIIRNR